MRWLNITMIKLAVKLLVAGFIAVIVVGCASSSKPPLVDFREERMVALTDHLDSQRKKIDALTAEVKELKRIVAARERSGPAAPVAASKGRGAATAGASATRAKKRSDVAEAETALRDEGEVIADSTFESMHDYYQGLGFRREGKHDETVAAVKRFLKDNPNHIYADRAHYLMVESFFQNREYQQAVIAANKLLSRYPLSFRAPDALFYRSLSYRELGQFQEAREGLSELVRRFPKSERTGAARAELSALSTRTRRASADAPQLLDRTVR